MKKIGFWTALALVIGNIIGAGIFTTTGYLAEKITDPRIFLLAWLVGGLYAICGAFVYGLLAKKMPVNGGDYVYDSTHLLHRGADIPVCGQSAGRNRIEVRVHEIDHGHIEATLPQSRHQ